MEHVELLVRMDCTGCENKVRKQLSKLKGVNSVEIDLHMNKVIVCGVVDRKKVLKAVRKSGKRAEFWQEVFTSLPYPSYDEASTMNNLTTYHSHSHSITSPQIHPFKRTYNYEKHGYNNYDYINDKDVPSYDQYDSTSHRVPSIFSDEDPNHACSIL